MSERFEAGDRPVDSIINIGSSSGRVRVRAAAPVAAIATAAQQLDISHRLARVIYRQESQPFHVTLHLKSSRIADDATPAGNIRPTVFN